MAFYDTADFIDAFRNGGCFLFEGEEDQKESSEDKEEVTERESDGDDTPGEPDIPDKPKNDSNGQDADTQPPAPEQEPAQQPSEETKSTDPEAVNTDDVNRGKQTFTADQIVQEFKRSGAEKATLQYAMSKLNGGRIAMQESSSGKPVITLKMLLPYIKAGIEKFCQKQEFSTSVSEMAKAVMAELKSLSAPEVQKQKAKVASAQKQAAQKQQLAAQKDNPPQQ